jgi:hypothetical protein
MVWREMLRRLGGIEELRGLRELGGLGWFEGEGGLKSLPEIQTDQ